LPDDPYYKLGLQAELNRREHVLASGSVDALGDKEGKSLSLLDMFAALAKQVLAGTPAAASTQSASSAWTTTADFGSTGEAFEHVIPAPTPLGSLAPSVGAGSSGLMAEKIDSVVVSQQAESEAWPAKGKTEDRFGEMRRADESGYISRIGLGLQQAKMPDGRYSLEKAELDDFAHRFARLNSRLADKVHGTSSFAEGQSLYVDAWRVVATCRLYLPGSCNLV